MSLLLLLTIQNVFVYGGDVQEASVAATAGSDDNAGSNPAGPDEKSPNAPVSFNEEFIHKHTELADPFWTNCFFNFVVTDTDKLHVTHFEIVSPPPDNA